MAAFEGWLLRRVGQAVEAGEVSAALLPKQPGEMHQAKELSQEEGHALAVRDIAERENFPLGQTETMRAAVESQPTETRRGLLLQITLRTVPIRLLHR